MTDRLDCLDKLNKLSSFILLLRMPNWESPFKIFYPLLLLSLSQLANGYFCSSPVLNSQLNCVIFSVSSSPNCSAPLQFWSCSFNNVCLNQSQGVCLQYSRASSGDQYYCKDQCKSSSTSNVDYHSVSEAFPFLIFFALLSAILCFVVFCWAIRRCCGVAEYRASHEGQQNQHRVEYPENGVQSERRLGVVPTLDEQNGWNDYDLSADILPGRQQLCVVCLENKNNAYLPCGHGFHCACVKEWMQRKATCPLCKLEIRQIRIVCFGCGVKALRCSSEQLKSLSIIQECPTCQKGSEVDR